MPITPRFRLSQSDSQLTVTIHIPHVRVSASTIEVIVDGTELHFFSTPYLLHLNFPHQLLDDEESGREAKAVYDPSKQNGILTLNIWKEEAGLWEDLDLLGRLMNISATEKSKNDDLLNFKDGSNKGVGMNNSENVNADANSTKLGKISVISSTNKIETDNQDAEGMKPKDATTDKSNIGDAEIDDFEFDDSTDELQSCRKPHYGFLNMFHSVFTAYAREGLSHEMLELPCPDETKSEERRELRLEKESELFDPNRFLGDLNLSQNYDDDDADMIFVEAINLQPHWREIGLEELTSGLLNLSTTGKHEGDSDFRAQKYSQDFFSCDESLLLTSIKSKIPDISKINKEQTQSLLLSLMDILFAYVYDHRTTSADPTCESSWTIVTLSPTLSWFETYVHPYDGIPHVLRWCIRRGLIYPYLRNYDLLSKTMVEDVSFIFKGGRRVILRCLLQIRAILDKSEFHYLFNKIYIDPFICWIQMIEEEVIRVFSSDLKRILNVENLLDKRTIELDLDVIERNVSPQSGGESDSEDISSGISNSSSSSEESDGETSDDETTFTNEMENYSSPANAQKQKKEHTHSLLDKDIGGVSNELLEHIASNSAIAFEIPDKQAQESGDKNTQKVLIQEM